MGACFRLWFHFSKLQFPELHRDADRHCTVTGITTKCIWSALTVGLFKCSGNGGCSCPPHHHHHYLLHHHLLNMYTITTLFTVFIISISLSFFFNKALLTVIKANRCPYWEYRFQKNKALPFVAYVFSNLLFWNNCISRQDPFILQSER